MPLPFEEFQGKGVFVDFSSSSSSSSSEPPLLSQNTKTQKNKEETEEEYAVNFCYAGEPTSVLETIRSPSPLTSSSTLSSSHAGHRGGTAASIEVEDKKCGQMGTAAEDWDSVLSGSPSQEHSILRLIMGDVEDPSLGLNKILQDSSELNGSGFGVPDPGFGLDSVPVSTANHSNLVSSIAADSLCSSGFPGIVQNVNALFSSVSLPQTGFPPQTLEGFEELPQTLNPQVIMNQSQAHFTQNPSLFMPVPYGQPQEQYQISPPPAKRLNQGQIGFGPGFYPAQRVSFPDSTRPGFQKPVTTAAQQIQQEITDQLVKAAELIETGGDQILAQGILARLNQQLSSPVGKPFQRAAFYFKEALQKQLILRMNNTNPSPQAFSSYSLIFKIGAYKSFSEMSPVIQFANFTSNQVLLESFQGFDRVHIIDFNIGYGGQWASLMQELVLRNGGPPSLKITAFASQANHDELELGFTQENLKHFAAEINISLEIEVLELEMLTCVSWHSSEKEAVAINLPVASFTNTPSYLPLVLRFLKQICPKIVVCSERGYERTDLPFPQQLINSLQSHSALLDSLDAVNANLDTMQKIERFLIQPSIEKMVVNCSRPVDRTVPWRALFLQMGFSPLILSNFTESQAECLVQKTPIRGFHVEKKQNSLVLCWQRKELVSVSAWRC